jgi:hypothetical protein
LWLEALPQSI